MGDLLVPLGVERDTGGFCGCGKKTGRRCKAMRATSPIKLDGMNSSGKERAVQKVAVRHVSKQKR